VSPLGKLKADLMFCEVLEYDGDDRNPPHRAAVQAPGATLQITIWEPNTGQVAARTLVHVPAVEFHEGAAPAVTLEIDEPPRV
jgi:hypothetical protein